MIEITLMLAAYGWLAFCLFARVMMALYPDPRSKRTWSLTLASVIIGLLGGLAQARMWQ